MSSSTHALRIFLRKSPGLPITSQVVCPLRKMSNPSHFRKSYITPSTCRNSCCLHSTHLDILHILLYFSRNFCKSLLHTFHIFHMPFLCLFLFHNLTNHPLSAPLGTTHQDTLESIHLQISISRITFKYPITADCAFHTSVFFLFLDCLLRTFIMAGTCVCQQYLSIFTT